MTYVPSINWDAKLQPSSALLRALLSAPTPLNAIKWYTRELTIRSGAPKERLLGRCRGGVKLLEGYVVVPTLFEPLGLARAISCSHSAVAMGDIGADKKASNPSSSV